MALLPCIENQKLMNKQKNFVAELTKLFEKAKTDVNIKYLTTKQINDVYGIPSKLNQSHLSVKHKQFIPSVRLIGGRRKYFERKVMDRLFVVANNALDSGRTS